MGSWSAPTSPEEVARRAGGRRRYNARRQIEAVIRQREVAHLLSQTGKLHGVQADIARQLGVSKSTISRDMKVLTHTHLTCPVCSSFVPRERLERKAEMLKKQEARRRRGRARE